MKSLLIAALFAATFTAHARQPAVQCHIGGWVKVQTPPNAAGDTYGDPDWPQQVVLYADTLDDAVLATLPDAFEGVQYDYLQVEMLGYHKSSRLYVRIRPYGTEDPHAIEGFLDVAHIGVALQTHTLYGATSDGKIEKKLVLGDGSWLGERGEVQLRGCQGEFARIDYRQTSRINAQGQEEIIPEGERQTLVNMWARGICPRLETTCDMPSVDEKP